MDGDESVLQQPCPLDDHTTERKPEGRAGKREKRAAAKTLSVASAHRKANAAKESHEATAAANLSHAAGDGG